MIERNHIVLRLKVETKHAYNQWRKHNDFFRVDSYDFVKRKSTEED